MAAVVQQPAAVQTFSSIRGAKVALKELGEREAQRAAEFLLGSPYAYPARQLVAKLQIRVNSYALSKFLARRSDVVPTRRSKGCTLWAHRAHVDT